MFFFSWNNNVSGHDPLGREDYLLTTDEMQENDYPLHVKVNPDADESNNNGILLHDLNINDPFLSVLSLLFNKQLQGFWFESEFYLHVHACMSVIVRM